MLLIIRWNDLGGDVNQSLDSATAALREVSKHPCRLSETAFVTHYHYHGGWVVWWQTLALLWTTPAPENIRRLELYSARVMCNRPCIDRSWE